MRNNGANRIAVTEDRGGGIAGKTFITHDVGLGKYLRILLPSQPRGSESSP